MKIQYMIHLKLTKIKDENFTTYLTKIVTEGIHRWKFKIIECLESPPEIGLIKIPSNEEKSYAPNLNQYFVKGGIGYAYITSTGRISNPISGYSGKKYGVKCKNNDIIDMHLDLEKYELRYYVNNKDQGKAYDVDEEIRYKAAITMDDVGSKIQLISYEQIK